MRTCKNDKVTIAHGHNRWLLTRTDRDAPTLQEVIQTTGAFLSKILGPASPLAQRGALEVIQDPNPDEDLAAFFIGAARPVRVIYASQKPPPREMFSGSLLGRAQDCPTVRLVKAGHPWFVVVDFDWRGPDTRIAWPARAVNDFGIPTAQTHSLDWLLGEARLISAAPAKADTSLSTEMGKHAREKLREAAKLIKDGLDVAAPSLLIPAVVVGGLLLAYGYAKRKN